MLFNSLIFLVFFALVLFVYYLPLPWKVKKTHLWISTIVDWFVGKVMADTKRPMQKRALLILSLCVNLDEIVLE